MRFLTLRKITFTFLSLFFYAGIAQAQEGQINLSQDARIGKLLTYKTEVNDETDNETRFKIQIFSGSLKNAKNARAKFQSRFYGTVPKIKFETPNYKVWVGNFRTSLEADRYLEDVKRVFPNAFKFMPKRKK